MDRRSHHGGQRHAEEVEMEHYNPMFMDLSLERAPEAPPPRTQYHFARYGHVQPATQEPESELQTEGAYGLYHTSRERYGQLDGMENPLDENSMESLLSRLPSRQLDAAATNTARALSRQESRKRSAYNTMKRGRKETDDLLEDMLDSTEMIDAEEEERMEEAIRSIPATISTKRGLMKRLSAKKRNAPGKLKRMKYSFGMAWKHFREKLADLKYTFYLWRGPLKKIEGHFGTGVLSYFLFLKWMLFINIPTVLLTLGFVCVPQILYRWLQQQPRGFVNNTEFTGVELLTGAGWFSDTVMYYGYYTTDTINITTTNKYEMQVAYLFTSGGYYLLTLIILGHSVLRSYKTYYISASGAYTMSFINKILGNWDYGITSPEAIRLKHQSIYTEIKEYLAGAGTPVQRKTRMVWCKWFLWRAFTNFIVLLLLVGAGTIVYYLSREQVPESEDETKKPLLLMVLPFVIGLIHLILPMIFSLIEHYEGYELPKNELFFHITRSMLLRLSTLGVLAYYWYSKIARSDSVQCWETYVGQEVYRLVVIELIFTLFGTFFSEFIRRLLSTKIQRLERAEFPIGRYSLELIYAQTLCWLGTFYAPLLSLIVVIKLVIVFYVKETSARQNCKPSSRPWRAARAHTIFMVFLLFSFLFAMIAVAIGIVFIQPSKTCGPYQGKDVMYSIVTELVDGWEDEHAWLSQIIDFISSPGFIWAILVFLAMGVYYVRTMMIGRMETVRRLQQQLVLEGKDKTFLLNLLNQVSKQGGKRAIAEAKRPLTKLMASEPDLASQGGHVFVRRIAESAAMH